MQEPDQDSPTTGPPSGSDSGDVPRRGRGRPPSVGRTRGQPAFTSPSPLGRVSRPESPALTPLANSSRQSPRRASRSPRRGPTPLGKSLLLKTLPRTPSRRVRFHEPPPITITITPLISTVQNFWNACILVAVAIPAIWLGYLVCTQPPGGPASEPLQNPQDVSGWLSAAVDLNCWLKLGMQQPLIFVNLVLLLNVDLLFWLIALVQGTTWLIDPYWTFIPVLILTFYAHHPLASSNPWRGVVASSILRTWAVRLTHSYFRREEWQFGAREDWRYTDMAAKFGRVWPVLSFFATYLVQHGMLFGISLPLYAVYTSTAPWGIWDTVATVVAVTGMALSWRADNELRTFMSMNEERRDQGLAPILLFNTGLWKYSRHPNYCGEQLYWLGMALFAIGLGQSWIALGTLFNSLCMIPVTVLTEARMLRRGERADLYREYQRTTSVWIPWFKGQSSESQSYKDE